MIDLTMSQEEKDYSDCKAMEKATRNQSIIFSKKAWEFTDIKEVWSTMIANALKGQDVKKVFLKFVSQLPFFLFYKSSCFPTFNFKSILGGYCFVPGRN